MILKTAYSVHNFCSLTADTTENKQSEELWVSYGNHLLVYARAHIMIFTILEVATQSVIKVNDSYMKLSATILLKPDHVA